MRIIPAIDLKDGKCVRLFQGDFAKKTEFSDDPASVAREFSAFETSELHIVDLDGAQSGKQTNRRIIETITETTSMSVQLGGGIRDGKTVEKWLAAGVSRCVIGSMAVTEPEVVKNWLEQFGGDRIVLALDVRLENDGSALLTTHGWTQSSTTSVFDCIDEYLGVGLCHVLCTDVGRDGALTGPNIALYRRILERFPDLQLQASGGVRSIADLRELQDHGIPAAITGRALLEGRISKEEIASLRQNA